MSLKDDDKKFIKNTIDDALDKRENLFKKSEASQKSSRLKEQIAERKERQDYLKQLKTLQANGEATMAQKFELMKEEVNSKISQDVKDTVKTSIQSVSSGANKIGSGMNKAASGVDGLITRIAGINPVLAALYAGTKGVSKDLWNIGSGAAQLLGGGAQMAWGGAKAVGGLVGSTMSSMQNMYLRRKRKDIQETPEQTIDLDVPVPVTQNEGEEVEQTEIEIPSLLPEKDTEGSKSLKEMQDRIKDIHEATVKDGKKNAESQLKSLTGLMKTMESINQVMGVLKAKQTLIVTGVLLGAAAIVGLVAWFKSGGFANLLNGLKKSILSPDDSTPTPESMPLDASGFDITTLNTGDYNNFLDKKKDSFTGIDKQSEIKKVMGTKFGGKPTVKQHYMEFQVGDLTPIVAPFDGICTDLKMKTQQDGRLTWVMKIHAMHALGAGHTMGDKFEVFQLDGVTNPQVTENQEFAKGEIIAYATKEFKISSKYEKGLKDYFFNYQSYINQQKDNNWKDVIYTSKNQQTEQRRQLTQDDTYKAIRKKYGEKEGQGFWDRRKEAAKSVADSYVDERLRDYTKDSERVHGDVQHQQTEEQPVPNQTDNFDQAHTNDAGTPTGGAANITPITESENAVKVEEQNKQLTEATKPQPQTENKGVQGTLPNLTPTNITLQNNTFSPDTYSNQPTALQYGLMARSQHSIMGN